MSDDGRYGLTLIAFLGSVFSPYYAAARRGALRGGQAADPLDHCAVNIALYGRHGGRAKRWAMTERGRGALTRERSTLSIGPSSLCWDGDRLTAEIDELTVPLPSRIRGSIRLWPAALVERSHALDAAGDHRWWPIAPCARVEVALERPALRWSGRAYLDSNQGASALEDAFERWHWSRSTFADGSTAVLYDATRRGGEAFSLARRFWPSGQSRDFEPPAPMALPGTFWWVDRATRGEVGAAMTLRRTFEDTPFYSRSQLMGPLCGEPVETIHESLALDRFRRRWVQLLLPFRMPRAPARS